MHYGPFIAAVLPNNVKWNIYIHLEGHTATDTKKTLILRPVSLKYGIRFKLNEKPYDKYLTIFLLTWRICWAPNNVSRWQMGFNPYPANVENIVSS